MIRKLLRSSLFFTLAVPFALRAEVPATAPSVDIPVDKSVDRDRPGRMGGGMGGGMGMGRGRFEGRDERDFSPEDVEKAKAFAKEHFPNRYAAYESIGDERPMRWMFTRRMVSQWRRLMTLQEQQPEMFEAVMREQTLMDEAFGLMRDVRDSKPGAEEKLRAKVIEIVENQLKDRKAKIEKLEKALQEQKDQLSRDQNRKDELVDKRLDQLEKDTKPIREREERNESPDAKPQP